MHWAAHGVSEKFALTSLRWTKRQDVAYLHTGKPIGFIVVKQDQKSINTIRLFVELLVKMLPGRA